jgi:hypothetical protein
MVGQGILRECLLDARVTTVLTIGRNATGQQHAKLREITLPDLFDLAPIADRLAGYDVCFFSLGVSSVGMTEEQYTHTTYDLTLSVAHTLLDLNPALIFFYISGAGTDSTEKGRSMWARVKGRTENDLLRMPFKAAYMLRPGFIAPTVSNQKLPSTECSTELRRRSCLCCGEHFPAMSRRQKNWLAP